MSVAEISQSLQLTSVKDHQWHIQACCALTGEGWELHLLFTLVILDCKNVAYVCTHTHTLCFYVGKCCCNTVCIQRFYLNACLYAFLPLSLPHPCSSTTLPMSSLPPGCARVLSGWCHGYVWDDDLWLWSRACPCSLFSLPPDMTLKWGWGWGRLMDGPLLFPVMLTWADRCQDVIFFCDNLFYKRRLDSEQKRDLFRRTLDNKRDSNYLKWNFCTVFLSAKHRGQQSVRLRTVHRLILQLCVSLAHGGLAVLPDWLWWFLLPPCVYSPVFSFNVVPAAECSKRWWLMVTETCRKEGKITICPLPFSLYE